MWEERRRSVSLALRGGEDGFVVVLLLLMVGSWLFDGREGPQPLVGTWMDGLLVGMGLDCLKT